MPAGFRESHLVQFVDVVVQQIDRRNEGLGCRWLSWDNDAAETLEFGSGAAAYEKPSLLNAFLEHPNICRDSSGGISGEGDRVGGVEPSEDVPCLCHLILRSK
ncbi:hypothetical protein AA313_de0205075 [Arthrobotrys entomopaga]|nr:hypothetical protein AA313_de0205075 [Arthrobotrys entomopaga]